MWFWVMPWALISPCCGSEHERAGLAWKAPRFLDVRDLARLLRPDLPDFSLETLAAWLGIAVVERHRALPDARLAAEVFLALLPRLRGNSIRTLAEAEDACRKLATSPGKAGWHEAALSAVCSCSCGQLSLPAPGEGRDVKAAAYLPPRP